MCAAGFAGGMGHAAAAAAVCCCHARDGVEHAVVRLRLGLCAPLVHDVALGVCTHATHSDFTSSKETAVPRKRRPRKADAATRSTCCTLAAAYSPEDAHLLPDAQDARLRAQLAWRAAGRAWVRGRGARAPRAAAELRQAPCSTLLQLLPLPACTHMHCARAGSAGSCTCKRCTPPFCCACCPSGWPTHPVVVPRLARLRPQLRLLAPEVCLVLGVLHIDVLDVRVGQGWALGPVQHADGELLLRVARRGGQGGGRDGAKHGAVASRRGEACVDAPAPDAGPRAVPHTPWRPARAPGA